jgi:hypothetical protein
LKATPEEDRKYTQPKTVKHRECKGKGCGGCDGGKIVVEPPRLYSKQRENDETLDEYRARLRAHIADSPDRYYQRGEIVRLESEEREAAFDMWQLARLIREAQLAERHPRNPDSCAHWGRTCSYFDVCTGVAALGDPLRFRRADTAHEELTDTTEAT